MGVHCKFCDDGDNGSVYPYYGLAPHKHDIKITETLLGITAMDSKDTWPQNFSEDPKAKGCGTYTHCLNCGAPGAVKTKSIKDNKQ